MSVFTDAAIKSLRAEILALEAERAQAELDGLSGRYIDTLDSKLRELKARFADLVLPYIAKGGG